MFLSLQSFLTHIMNWLILLIGMVVGLLVSTENTAKWIYAGTAGTFMYVALADLVPELKHDQEPSVKQVLLNVMGVLLGTGIMLLIGLYEDSLRMLFDDGQV